MMLASYWQRAMAHRRTYGTLSLVRAVAARVKPRLAGKRAAPLPSFRAGRGPHTPAVLEQESFRNLRAIRAVRVPGGPRLTVVTDSVGKSSLFGGVGTALLLGGIMANRLGAQFRLLTRTEPPSPASVQAVFSAYGLRLDREPQFHWASIHNPAAEMETVDGEIFITTSWWTTHSLLKGVHPSQIVYLLQEDERMFYPHGDERLRCELLLSRADIRYVVNTRLLLDHLIADGLHHLRESAVSFEPAFPAEMYYRRGRPAAGSRKQFFFYARPNHPRNLFLLGLQVVDQAFKRGVLAADEWELLLVGKDVPRIDFGADVRTRYVEGLDWAAYAELCGGVDLALSLMYTPHPSYPPLDLAASGAVVVTNRYGVKQTLESFSRNILCADLDVESLLEALREGAALASSPQRDANARAAGLSRDWAQSFEPVLQRICEA